MSGAASVEVLREHGPLDLREITRLTARRLGCSLMYEDVAAVLQRERAEGRVVLVADAADYRSRIWMAVEAGRVSSEPAGNA